METRTIEAPDETERCKVCGRVAGYDKTHDRLDQCRACGFVTFRDYDPSALLDIYGEDYFSKAEYPDYIGQQNTLRKSMRRHLKQMARYPHQRDSLLEVGCAYGLFLDEARHHYRGVKGVDVCAAPVAYAENTLDLDARCENFLEMDFGSEKFDVICLWDTIEHLEAPERYVAKAARLLNESGMLFLTTGDIGSLNARLRGRRWRQIHPPSHLHYFSRETMTRLLGRLGFQVAGIETASYYHTIFNVLASIRLRGGAGGSVAATLLTLSGEKLTRRLGFWINLRDIMFVAARLKP